MSTTEVNRFVSPYDDPAPGGAEGWEELYPYYLRFREDRREFEESRFWFADLQHWPTVFKPFDTITVEFAIKCLGQYNTRHLLIPPANGIDYRVHNGYVYMSPVPVPEEKIPARVPQFTERAGHYFANWTSLLQDWETKVRRVIADLDALEFEPLPEVVPISWIKEGRGLDNTFALAANYDRAIELCYEALAVPLRVPQPRLCRLPGLLRLLQGGSPSIADLGIAKMVAGVDVDAVPARRGAASGSPGSRSSWRSPTRLPPRRMATWTRRWPRWPPRRAAQWVAEWEAAKDPGSTSPRATACTAPTRCGSTTWRSRSGFIRDYIDGCRRRGDRASDRRSTPSATASSPSTANCCPRRGAGGVRREARAVPARVPLCRGSQLLHRALVACRSSGARSAGWARCSPTPASGRTPTTSSMCAATSCSR